MRRRRQRGWGFEGEELSPDEVDALARVLAVRFPHADLDWKELTPPVPLPAPRLRPPRALASRCAVDEDTRRLHAVGRAYIDVVRAARGQFPHPPDVVATPSTTAQVSAVLEWCAAAGAVCVPFGGGTSVVGGVEAVDVDAPVVAMQTRSMARVVEIDRMSGAARIEAGATGPELETQLGAAGLTLRFFPQSFELSTLGGWLATRAAGHCATGPTHIDDLVEQITAVTPVGVWSSRRLPASGAGPSPDRLLLGSEGVLGVITEAWVRVRERPRHRSTNTVRFASFGAGAAAVRGIVQAGLQPANCRLLDALEAQLAGAGDGGTAVLVLGFESAHHPVDMLASLALDVCRDAGGSIEAAPNGRGAENSSDGSPETADRWKATFLRAPYLRDGLVGLGVVVETFETAVVWSAFEEFHARVLAATEDAARAVCGDAVVTARLTHAYPDGVAPYYTVLAPGRRGNEIAQWRAIKAAAAEAILAAGGTITHHHAVGREHRPWYDRQRPEPFAVALRAAKAALDPDGLLNPGVLVDATAATEQRRLRR